jgi:hypothetical protein
MDDLPVELSTWYKINIHLENEYDKDLDAEILQLV